MQKENIKEYELIRTELLSVKNCTTDYIGFTLGGSGLAIFGLGLIINESPNDVVLFYVPLAISIVITLILYILYYKFNSNNRFAGYSYVLSIEEWRDNENGVENLIVWEPCIMEIRDIDLHPDEILELINELPEHLERLKPGLMDYYKHRRERPIKQWKSGLKILLTFTFGMRLKSGSWMYPLWVTVAFALIISMFLGVSYYFGVNVIVEHWSQIKTFQDAEDLNVISLYVMLGILLFAFVFQIRMSLHLWSKLYHLIEGDASVRAYAERFQLLRGKLLPAHGIRPVYRPDRGDVKTVAIRPIGGLPGGDQDPPGKH